ncbi:hypothetical protein E2C01_076499 [Portunus trituberculatus]|uniref:Uncharacterized protein n=1 Tax=Portunus trituberculatus TaxID=210409 RepID=A0A5B7I8W1_PORTR|nr:hypothetical protein [Portunus trituberculatus]
MAPVTRIWTMKNTASLRLRLSFLPTLVW